jgi:hypothetical protein
MWYLMIDYSKINIQWITSAKYSKNLPQSLLDDLSQYLITMLIASSLNFFCVYVRTYSYVIMILIRRISPSPSGDRDALRHHVRPARGRYKRYLTFQSCVFCLIPYRVLSLFLLTSFHDFFFHSSIRSFVYLSISLSTHSSFVLCLQCFGTFSLTRPYFSVNLDFIPFFNL